MEETLKLYWEYVLRVMTNWNWEIDLAFLLGAGLAGSLLYFNTHWHQERVMSKNKVRARHRKVLDIAAQQITEALEQQEFKGVLKRKEIDYIYDMLRKGTKLKELGRDPSFGRPWYYGVAKLPNAAKVKAEIMKRMPDLTKAGWPFNLAKENAAREKHKAFLASLRPKA